MKIKQHLILTEPLNFAKGDYDDCFTLFEHAPSVEGWFDCGEVEFEVDIDTKKVIQSSLEAIEAKEQEIKDKAAAALEALRAEKSTLLAIGHDA